MNKSINYKSLIAIFIFLALAGLGIFRFKSSFVSANLPAEKSYQNSSSLREKPNILSEPDPALPEEINLQVPFTSQAPQRNWDFPFKEFCEEASMLMAASYINNQPISGPEDATEKLLVLHDFAEKKLGLPQDTTAEETALILKEFYQLEKIKIVHDPKTVDIKQALAEGKIVLVPLAGRQLNNPYYQQPGPLYHMLVIKGYRKNGDFITHDPGTRRGENFIYKADTIMNALHDWNNGKVDEGEKVMIVVG